MGSQLVFSSIFTASFWARNNAGRHFNNNSLVFLSHCTSLVYTFLSPRWTRFPEISPRYV